MSDLKPGCVRVFQCEHCGEIFNQTSGEARYGMHIVTLSGYNRFGEPEGMYPERCGPITERILSDPDVVRRETIEECANAVGSMNDSTIITRVQAMRTIRALSEREEATCQNE